MRPPSCDPHHLAAENRRIAAELERAVKAAADATVQLQSDAAEHSAWADEALRTWQAEKALIARTEVDSAAVVRNRLEVALRRAKRQSASVRKGWREG